MKRKRTEDDWVGHPGSSATYPDNWSSTTRNTTELRANHKFLVDNAERMWILAQVSDPNQDYSFDQMAIVQVDKKIFLCQTTGCSCPSPWEVWFVHSGPFHNLRQVIAAIKAGEYAGCTLPQYEHEDLLGQLEDCLPKPKIHLVPTALRDMDLEERTV